MTFLKRFMSLIFSSIATLAFIMTNPTTNYAHEITGPLPIHNLSIEFDLEKQNLTGFSRITVPGEVGFNLDLGKLDINSFQINRNKLDEMPEDGVIPIPATPEDKEIFITFRKSWPSGNRQNLITSKAIILTGFWHPIADHDMIIKLNAIIPKNFDAVSEADEIIVFPSDKGKLLTFRYTHPVQVLHFIAANYEVSQEKFSDGKILASYFFPEDKDLAASYREKALQYLKRYEKMLGPYPYQRFSIVENLLPTGYAMPSFTLLGQVVVRLPFIKDTSLGHEILHEWFGNSVMIDPTGGNWAEGLTAYLADQSFAEDKGRGSEFRKEQLVNHMSYVMKDNELTLFDFSGAEDSSIDAKKVRAIGYGKSSMFFHMLKNKVGDENFYESLREFYKRMIHRRAGWADLLASFENVTNSELADFFGQWLVRTDILSIGANKIKLIEEDGRPVLSFQIIQGSTPSYDIDVPIMVRTSQGEIKKIISISGHSTPVEIPLSSSPLELIIDESYDLMRELHHDELPPTWSRFAGAVSKVAVLETEKSSALYAPLIDLLEKMNCRIISADEATDTILSEAAVIFLGIESLSGRGLFARPAHPESGFTVDIRENPLNTDHVAVLVSAADNSQVTAAISKLPHYGKYGFLHFEDGTIKDKIIPETNHGVRYTIDQTPMGIDTSSSVPFDDIINNMLDDRVIYVGESHTNYEDHILQLRVIRALHEKDPNMAIGMEMFTRSTQPVIDSYLARKMEEKEFLKKSHYYIQWKFDYRLYRDIINFARRNRIPIIALNTERNIVNSVFKGGGTSALNEEQIQQIPDERDLDVPGYRERIESAFQMHPSPGSGQNRKFSGFLQAQALWDETMAETVADYLKSHPEDRVVVLAGRGHTVKDTGIPPRVYRRIPVKQTIVLNTDGKDINPLQADYLFFSPSVSLPPAPMLGVMLEETEDKIGIKVAQLSELGRAKSSGIRKNDIIIGIDQEPVSSLEDIKLIMLYKQKSKEVVVSVKRPHKLFPDETLEFTVSLKQTRSPH